MDWFAGYLEAAEARVGHTFFPGLAIRTVYCLSEGLGQPVKLGISQDIRERHAGLRTSTWRDIAFCWVADGHSYHEAALKLLLRDRRIRCEWLHDTDDRLKFILPQRATQAQLEAVIAGLAAESGHPPYSMPRGPRPAAEPVLWIERHQQEQAA